MVKGRSSERSPKREHLSEKDRQGLYRKEKEKKRIEKMEKRNRLDKRWDDDSDDNFDF